MEPKGTLTVTTRRFLHLSCRLKVFDLDVCMTLKEEESDGICYISLKDKVHTSYHGAEIELGRPYDMDYNKREGIHNIWVEVARQLRKFLDNYSLDFKTEIWYDCNWKLG